jgi:hypothetical protein
VVVALAGSAVVATTCRDRGHVEAAHGGLVLGLEGEVEALRRRAVRGDPELVAGEVAVAGAHLAPERTERGLVEAPAPFEVAHAQVDVVERPAEVDLHDATMPGGGSGHRVSLFAMREKRGMRPLPMAATGQPAPFRLGAPAYVVALGGWLAATLLLASSADELVGLFAGYERIVGAAHAIGLVFFPFAVAAAVWQLLPVMLRNDPPRPGLRWLALPLVGAGIPLAVGLATERTMLAWVGAAFLAAGMALVLAELALLVRGAPEGRLLVVSRPAVALAGGHAAAAFALGAVALADGGPEPLGVPYERLLLVHVMLALVGWLTVLVMAVGRTLVPMLGLAAAAARRSAPVAELVLVAGLWTLVAGVVTSNDVLVALGALVMAGALAPSALLFARVALAGKIGFREGPVAHVVAGLAFLLQAALLMLLAAGDVVDGRRAAVASVLLVGLGWAVGVIVGHLGKLISLSGWGSWPPGPRPKQGALYPLRGWQLEVALFALGVELLAVGVIAERVGIAQTGGVLLGVSAFLALACAVETVRRTFRGRRAHDRERPGTPGAR